MASPVPDIQALIALLTSARQGPTGKRFITLDAALLPAGGVLAGLLDAPGAKVTVTENGRAPLLQPDAAKGEVKIVGTADLFAPGSKAVGYDVTVTGRVPAANDPSFELHATPTDAAAWHFVDNFPTLPEFLGTKAGEAGVVRQASFFGDAGLSSPVFTAFTAAQGVTPPHLGFSAALDPAAGDALGARIGKWLKGTIQLSGLIEQRAGKYPLISLSGATSFQIPRLGAAALELKTEAEDISGTGLSDALLVAHSDIKGFPAFAISGSVLSNGDNWALEIGFEDKVARKEYTLAHGLSALVDFVGGTPLSLPAGIDAVASMYLRAISVGLRLEQGKPPEFEFLGVSIGYARDWPIPLPGGRISDVAVEWQISNPLSGSAHLYGSVSGNLVIGDKAKPTAVLAMRADISGASGETLPSVILSADLAERASIDKVVKHFAGFDPGLEVDVDALSLQIDTGERTLLFFGSLSMDKKIPVVPLALSGASFGVQVTPNRVTGSLGVGFNIGNLPLAASAEYRGAGAGWLMSGGLAPDAASARGVPPGGKAPVVKVIKLGDWLESVDGARFAQLPATIGNIELRGLSLSYDTTIKRFDFDTVVGWTYTLDSYNWDLEAEFQLTAISKTAKTEYAGKLRGRIMVDALAVSVIYSFDTADNTKDGTVTFEIAYNGATLGAVLSTNKKSERILTVSLGNVSFGDILGFLVGLVEGSSGFRLPSPWDALYDVSFDGLSLEINLTTRAIGVAYPINLNLGLADIKTIALTYADKAGTRSVDIAITGRFVDQTYTEDDPLSWDLLNDPPPTPPGKGTQLLDLRFLALGHNVTFRDTRDFENVLQVITALEDDFKPLEDADDNPLAGLPALRFSSDGQWLVGADFTIMETVSLAGIFNDPVLYGIRLALAGKKSGALAGLAFEILYKKVTDDIGVYIIQLKLPDAMRQIQLGAVSITLPNVGIEIYTNGNFRIDVGFPKSGDYSGSFSLQVFPFVGFGGFYFAVLDGRTSDTVPKITNGEFSPVLEFGLGLSVGVGKTINEGVLKAGLTLTVEGILEGTLAWFNPNDSSVPADRFVRVRGTVAIVGKLYGEVNFVVIQVRVSVTASANATMTIQSYEPTQLQIVLRVEAAASIKILFITIHFSFEMELKLSFEIGEKGTSPWILAPSEQLANARQLHAQGDRAPRAPMTAARLMAAMRAETGERARIDFAVHGLQAGTPIPLDIVVMPAVTVAAQGQVHRLAASGAAGPALQVVVPLFIPNGIPHGATDAKDVAASAAGAEDAAFNRLVGAMFDWAVAAIDTNVKSPVFGAAGSGEVTIAHLEELSEHLQDPGRRRAAFSYANVAAFLSRNFVLRLSSPLGPSGPAGYEAALAGGRAGAGTSTSIFPMIPALKMSPDGQPQIDFGTHNPVSAEYLANLEAYFNELTSDPTRDVAAAQGAPAGSGGAAAGAPSMAVAIFESYFAMLAAGAVREAITLMKAYPLRVTAADSLNSIALAFGGHAFEYAARDGDTIDRLAGAFGIAHAALRRANPWMADLHGAARLAAGAPVSLPVGVSPETIAAANADYPLARGATLRVQGVRAQISAGDSLDGIARRFGLPDPRAIFDWQPPLSAASAGPSGMTGLLAPNPNAADPNLLRPGAAIWIAPQAGPTGATFGPTFARTIERGDLLGPSAAAVGRVAAFYAARNQAALDWPFSAWYRQRLADMNPGLDWTALPAGITVAAPVAGLTGGALVESGTTVYETRPGDTADLMAAYLALEQIGADVPDMAEAHAFFAAMRAQIRPQTGLQPGTTASVPGFRHILRAGETLDTLSDRFGRQSLAPPTLAWANRAAKDLLQPRGVVALPTLTRRTGLTGAPQTLAAVAADYNLTLDALADAVAGATGIFQPSGATGAQMTVPDVALRKTADLRSDMVVEGRTNRVAAMVSRFLMHGLRVADPAGPVGAAAWPPGVDLWGLYEMLGQQVPAPASLTASYGVDLALGATADWVSFAARPAGPTGAGPTGALKSLTLDLSPRYFSESAPSPTFAPQILRGPSATPLYDEAPRRFGLQKMLHWQIAAPLVLPGMTGADAPAAGEPTIWPFPDALNGAVADALAGRGATAGTRPYALIATPPGGAAGARAVTGYAWAGAVPIRIRRETAGGAPMQNTYQLLGADEAGRDTLLKAWTWLAARPAATDRLHVLFAPNPTGGNARGLASGVVDAADTYLLKTNLSTVTHSGVQALAPAPGPARLDYVAPLNAPERFLRMAWEASITASGGFYLHYAESGGAGLPETLFSNGNEADIWLVLMPEAKAAPDRALRGFDNCAVVGENIASAGLDLHARLAPGAVTAADLVRIANVPPGNVGFELERRDPTHGIVGASGPLSPAQQADLTRSLYSLLGWRIADNSWFARSNEATPLAPLPPGPSGPSGAWVYRHSAPVSVVGAANDMPVSPALPPAADNPYRGISGPQGASGPASKARLTFRFQDLYGNRTEATTPPAPLDVTVGYTDPVIGIGGWPGAAFDYVFRPVAKGAELHAALSFRIDGYVPGAGVTQHQAAESAAGDAARWRQIIYQVQQRDMGFALTSNLGDADLSGDRLKAPMAAFATGAWAFVNAAAKLKAVDDPAGAGETFGAFAAAHAADIAALAEANAAAMATHVFAGDVVMPKVVSAPPMNTLRRMVADHSGGGYGLRPAGYGGGLTGEVLIGDAPRDRRVRGLRAAGRRVQNAAQAPATAMFFAGSGLTAAVLAARNLDRSLSPGLVLRTAARTTALAAGLPAAARSLAAIAGSADFQCPVLADVRNPDFPGAPGASPTLSVGLLADNFRTPSLLSVGVKLSMTVQDKTATVDTKPAMALCDAFAAFETAFDKTGARISRGDFAAAIAAVPGLIADQAALAHGSFIIPPATGGARPTFCMNDLPKALGSVADLARWNEAAQGFFAPSTPIFIGSKTVTPGDADTLAALAQEAQISLAQWAAFNTGAALKTGAKLAIPMLAAWDAADLDAIFAAHRPTTNESLTDIAALYGLTGPTGARGLAEINRAIPGVFADGAGVAGATASAGDSFDSIWRGLSGTYPQFDGFIDAIAGDAGIFRPDGALAAPTPRMPGPPSPSLSALARRYNLGADAPQDPALRLAIANRGLRGFLRGGAQIAPPRGTSGLAPDVAGPWDTLDTVLRRFTARLAALNPQAAAPVMADLVAANMLTDGLFSPGAAFLTPPGPTELATPFAPVIPPRGAATAQDRFVFPAQVDMIMTRDRGLASPDFRGATAVWQASSSLVARGASAAGGALKLDAFAADFEDAFRAERLKCAVSRRHGLAADAASRAHVWAVNFGQEGVGDVAVNADAPQFYALPPLSTAPYAGTVEVKDYVPGKGLGATTAKRFDEADLDGWMRQLLSAVDLYLTPQYAGPSVELTGASAPLGAPEAAAGPVGMAAGPVGFAAAAPGPRGSASGTVGARNFDAIVNAKRDIAKALRDEVAPVLSFAGATAGLYAESAREALYQQMLVRLSAAYAVDAVVQYPVGLTSGFSPTGPAMPPRFSGKVVPDLPRAPTGAPTLAALARDVQVSAPFLAEILGDAQGVLRRGAVVQYPPTTGPTLPVGPTATLNAIAGGFGVPTDPTAPGYWAGWSDFVTGVSGQKLLTPGAEVPVTRIARDVNAGDTLALMASFAGMDVGSFAEANEAAPGIFVPGWTVSLGGARYLTKGSETLAEIAAALPGATVRKLAEGAEAETSGAPHPLRSAAILVPGQPLHAAQLLPDVTLSTSKVSLARDGGLAPPLTFFLETEHESRFRKLFLNLRYVINELEFDVTEVAAAGAYKASSWLTFVLPIGSGRGSDVGIRTAMPQVQAPLPLRSYPAPPLLTGQSALASDPDATSIADARLWDYRFDFSTRNADQDTDHLEVSFNRRAAQDPPARNTARNDALFKALAKFIAVWPALKNDLARLPGLKGGAQDQNAAAAVAALLELVKDAATALRSYGVNPMTDLPEETHAWRLTAAVDAADRSLRDLTMTPEAPLGVTGAVRPTLWPDAVLVKSPTAPTGGTGPDAGFVQLGGKDGFYTYPPGIAAGGAITQRVVFKRRDVIRDRNAWSGVYVARNEDLIAHGPLGPKGMTQAIATRPEFVYRTPVVRFVDPLTPFVVNRNPLSVAGLTGPSGPAGRRRLADHLTNMIAAMLAVRPWEGLRAEGVLQLRVSYAFGLTPGAGTPLYASTPILLMPAQAVDGGELAELVAELSGAVKDWHAAQAPSGAEGRLTFEAGVFAGGTPSGATEGTQKPILRLDDVVLPVEAVDWT